MACALDSVQELLGEAGEVLEVSLQNSVFSLVEISSGGLDAVRLLSSGSEETQSRRPWSSGESAETDLSSSSLCSTTFISPGFEIPWEVLSVGDVQSGELGLGASLASGLLSGFSGGSGLGEASREALGLEEGEPPPEGGGWQGAFPEESLGLGGALGGGGRPGGAEVLWRDAPFFGCSAPSLEVRVRRTTSG